MPSVDLGKVVGNDGVGIPSGGSAGQVLVKRSASNYDTQWETRSDDHGTIDTAPASVDAIMNYAPGNYRISISGTQSVFPTNYGLLEIFGAGVYRTARFTSIGSTYNSVWHRSWHSNNSTWYDTAWVEDTRVNSQTNYCELPDGTLIQWGFYASSVSVAANGAANESIALPRSFANTDYVIHVDSYGTGIPAQRAANCAERYTGSFKVNYENEYGSAWTPTISWIAVGKWK